MTRKIIAVLAAALAAPLPLLAHATGCPRIPHNLRAGEWFGFALAAEAATGRLAVGAPGEPRATGAVHVIHREAVGWSEEAEVHSNVPGDRFGTAVALHGERLAVGAQAGAGERAASAGVVYLFSHGAAGWRPDSVPRVTAPDGARGDQFGAAVALGTDTLGIDTLVVGAPGNGARGSLAGAVYVFRRSGTGWGPPQKLLADDAQPAAQFGSAVAITGNTLAVGAPFEDFPQRRRNFGAVYVFERTDGIWVFVKKLTAGQFDENDVQFGAAVAIDGDSLAVGAPGKDRRLDNRQVENNAGAVYRFTGSGSVWAPDPDPQDPLVLQDHAADDQLGWSVAIADNRVVAGALRHRKMDEVRSGAAFVFVGHEAQEPPFTGEDASAGSQFGSAVALSGDIVLVGGPRDDPNGTADAGSVAFCDIGPPPCDQPPTITKTGPSGTVADRQEIPYTVTVTNQCAQSLPGAQVRDTFDAKLETVKWCRDDGDSACTPVRQAHRDIDEVVTLPANASVTYRVTARVASTACGELVNRACVSVAGLEPACASVRNPIESEVDLSITKTGPTCVARGDLLTYGLEVRNDGPCRATGVVVLDPTPAGLTADTPSCPGGECQVGAIDPGHTVRLSLRFQVPECYSDLSPIVNRATVQANEPDRNSSNNQSALSTCVLEPTGGADLAVTKSVARPPTPAKVNVGDTVAYRIVVQNLGPHVACGAVLTDPVPRELAFSSASSGCTMAGGVLRCELRDLVHEVPEVPVTVTWEGVVRPTGCPDPEIVNAATASSSRLDTIPGNNTGRASVPCFVDLGVTKTDGLTMATAGTPLPYTITVGNYGARDISGATVEDFFPLPWCEGEGCIPTRTDPFKRTLNLAVGETRVLHFVGKTSPLFTGTVENTASVEPPAGIVDDNPANDRATDRTLMVLPPGFQLFCTGVEGPFAEGDAITCIFVLLNGGPSTQADNAGDEFTVTLPATLTLVSASATSGSTSTFGNTATWNGAVAVGGRVDISVSATVNAGTAGTTICIQGAAFLDTDGDGVNDTVFLSDIVDAPNPPPDPCCFRVLTPPEIPALSDLGMAVLILLLAAGALLRLRARRMG